MMAQLTFATVVGVVGVTDGVADGQGVAGAVVAGAVVVGVADALTIGVADVVTVGVAVAVGAAVVVGADVAVAVGAAEAVEAGAVAVGVVQPLARSAALPEVPSAVPECEAIRIAIQI